MGSPRVGNNNHCNFNTDSAGVVEFANFRRAIYTPTYGTPDMLSSWLINSDHAYTAHTKSQAATNAFFAAGLQILEKPTARFALRQPAVQRAFRPAGRGYQFYFVNASCATRSESRRIQVTRGFAFWSKSYRRL